MFKRRQLLLISICLFFIASSYYAAASELKLPFSGRYGAIFRYTPENKIESGFNLIANSGFTVNDQNLNLKVSIGSIWPGVDHINIPFPLRSFNVPYYLSGITIKTKEPLIRSTSSGTLTIGSIQANYSPFTIMLTTAAENPQRKGIGIDGIRVGKTVLDGLLVWKNDLDSPTLGCKTTYRGSKYALTGILSQNFLYSADDAKFNTEERVTSLELLYPVLSGTLAITAASQERRDDTKQIRQVIFNNKLPNKIGLKVSYRDFEPGYRPLFSDRKARVDRNSGAYRGWNLLDQYAGCKGTTINIDGKYDQVSYKITKEFYTNHDYYRDSSLRPGTINSEEVSFEGSPFGIQSKLLVKHAARNITNDFGNNIFFESNSIWGRFSKQHITKQIVYSNSFGFWKDNGAELLDEKGLVTGTITETGGEFRVSGSFRKGIFRGLTLNIGLKAISLPDTETMLYKSIGAEYQTRNGIELILRFTTPNFEEYKKYFTLPHGARSKYDSYVYDRFGEIVLLDNIFQIKYSQSY